MALDPTDVDELQGSLNDAAGKASALWTTFVTLELYLMIAFGSVTHRNLFLESPVKLPLLNVDLPLVGFFIVAPTILVILHFYVFLQLLALAAKAQDYDALLKQAVPVASDRQYMRHRLDSFLFLQFLAGPPKQKQGFNGFWLRLIAWITLVGLPVLILLQGQATFLPFHRSEVTWFQRGILVIDLIIIWHYWNNIRVADDSFVPFIKNAVWVAIGALLSLCVAVFSIGVATFPGEWTDQHFPSARIVPTTWWPVEADDWDSLHALLFAGASDEVTGQPRSLFSNRLVLTSQIFVDPDKIDKAVVGLSLRGRDLTQAVLAGSDLRKADFTGALLDGAVLRAANLENANFGCAASQPSSFNCTSLRGADLTLAKLQGSFLAYVNLDGAILKSAHLQGANLGGASLVGAELQSADLRGAYLASAHLHGANLSSAQLQGALLVRTELQGAKISLTDVRGASLVNASVWHTYGVPMIDSAELDSIDAVAPPWLDSTNPIPAKPDEQRKSFDKWRNDMLQSFPSALREGLGKRLAILNPDFDTGTLDVPTLTREFWQRAPPGSSKAEDERKAVANFVAELGCADGSAPYVARGLARQATLNLRNYGLPPSARFTVFINRLLKERTNPTACLGAKGIADEDWEWIYQFFAPDPNATPSNVDRKK